MWDVFPDDMVLDRSVELEKQNMCQTRVQHVPKICPDVFDIKVRKRSVGTLKKL